MLVQAVGEQPNNGQRVVPRDDLESLTRGVLSPEDLDRLVEQHHERKRSVALGVQVGMSESAAPSSPVRPYRTIVQDSNDPGYVNRILIGTATTGLLRVEWVQARYGQIIPANWSQVQMLQYLDSYMPLRYQVADAQNLIVKEVIEKDFEWVLFYEHDVCPQPDACIFLDKYLREAKVPVVSGLYFTRSRPSEPLVYRGRGTGSYTNWKRGDLVWCDGVPTGFLLVHRSLLKVMWDDSPEYLVGKHLTRRVFDTPRKLWFDPESQQYNTVTGTSDLDWCTRVLGGDYLQKSGWKHFVDNLPDPQFPFLVDTNLFCRHINMSGEQFP